MQHIKLLVVGDGGVGKSCLLISYCTNSFPSEYVPTVFDNYAANVMCNGKAVSVGFWDTAGQEDYDRLRPLCYPQTDIAVLCFDITNRASFENIEEKWLPELRHFIPEVPVLIVGCKNDIRGSRPDAVKVTVKEGEELAKRQGLHYADTSALTMHGLKACFDKAISLGLDTDAKRNRKKKKGGFFGGKSKSKPGPEVPIMPPAGKAPWIEIRTSTFAEDWQTMLESPKHSDVVFIVENTNKLNAHKIMLCSASKYFAKVLGITDSAEHNQLKKFDTSAVYTREELNSGSVCGIAAVYDEQKDDKSSMQTVITLSEDIKGKSFVRVLQFLYTGVPHFDDDVTEEDLDNLINVSRIFELRQLETICVNQKHEQEFLNPSIGTFLNDETGKKMKEQFFNKSLLADIVFKVEDQSVFAHKVVVSTRCDVMAAMFSGNFSEGSTDSGISEVNIVDTTAENFLALLEYVYTAHAPIENGDSVGILILANQFFQSRLSDLCELYITKEVEMSCKDKIERSDIDVIGLLHTAQFYNAEQLSKWCLHFISTNYDAFTRRHEFKQLKDSNLDYVKENRWPPLSYLQEVENYEKLMKERGQTCSIQ